MPWAPNQLFQISAISEKRERRILIFHWTGSDPYRGIIRAKHDCDHTGTLDDLSQFRYFPVNIVTGNLVGNEEDLYSQ